MNYLQKVILVFCVIAVCFCLLEIGLRISGRIPSNMTDGFFIQHGNSYRLKENITKTTKWPSFTYVTYTNSFGFRDKKPGKRNIGGKPFFVFLGASVVFGNGVNYEDSFVGKFEKSASKHGIDVLNLAVGGHNFLDQEALFIEFIQNISYKPSKVILCLNPFFIHNVSKKNDNIIVKNGYLFDKKGIWQIAYLKMMLANTSASYCFIRDNSRKTITKYFGSNDKHCFIKYYSKSNKVKRPESIKQLEQYLDRFLNYCHVQGIRPVFVYIPPIDTFSLDELLIKLGEDPRQYDTCIYEKILGKYCKDRKITFINPKSRLKAFHDEGKILRFKFDAHYNEFANLVFSDLLYNEIFHMDKTN